MSTEAEHQRDLDALTRAENARDQLQRDLATVIRQRTALHQAMEESLVGLFKGKFSTYVDLVRLAGTKLRDWAPIVYGRPAPTANDKDSRKEDVPLAPGIKGIDWPSPPPSPNDEIPMTEDELKEELQRINESDPGNDDMNRPGWFRDHAFLQALAGSAVECVDTQDGTRHIPLRDAACHVVDSAYEIAKQADKRRDW